MHSRKTICKYLSFIIKYLKMKEAGVRTQLLGRRCHWLFRFRSLSPAMTKFHQ